MNAQIDMSRFTEAKSDRLNADDLLGGPRTITVTGVSESGAEDGPVNIHYQGDNGKPFRPCKTMRRVMVNAWGASATDYVGRSMTIYRDADVQFGGMKLGGVRISHMSHIDGPLTLMLQATKKSKGIIKILPLATRQPATEPRSPAANPPADSDGQPHGASAGDAPAQDDPWLEWVMGALAGIAKSDRAMLAKWQAKRAGELATLETERPKLHADVMAAVSDRNAALDREVGE